MIKPERKKAWHAWHNMIRRCYNAKASSYHRYGGRGVTVCDRWLLSFENFFADMGTPPDYTSLDRKDNDGNYEPLNCQWSTSEEQSSNTCQTTKITFQGKTMSLRGWSRSIGISHAALALRLKVWPIQKALATPPPKTRRSHGR